jgi:metallo-beta-lactamase family protein
MAETTYQFPAHPDTAVLSFLGATGTVTGSRFLVDTPRARVLVDIGMFQGLKALRQRNWDPFPVDPATIDAIVVTHAHVDHIGLLPALVRDGFAGDVHTSHGTMHLAKIVLPDAGHLQEEEASYANRKGFSKHHPALPLYTEADARRSLTHLVPHPFGAELEIAPGIDLTLRTAGHILGASTVTLRLADHGDRRVTFSGDLGRSQHPLLRPPAPIGQSDVLVMESTYGDRRHDEEGAIERFADAITRTAARGGTVLIPAFAVDRTEVVLHHLRQMTSSGAIPALPIYVDSPMALDALSVYRQAIRHHDPEIRPDLDASTDPFDNGWVTEVRAVEDSKALADLHGPMIIVSASGMATGGRVVHHLDRLLPNARNTVLLVGFQAPGTRGRQLADGARDLKMFGRYLRVRAEVVDLAAFSVHADQDELVAWLGTAARPPEVTYLVHGEPDASEALRDRINADDAQHAVVPKHHERVRLD